MDASFVSPVAETKDQRLHEVWTKKRRSAVSAAKWTWWCLLGDAGDSRWRRVWRRAKSRRSVWGPKYNNLSNALHLCLSLVAVSVASGG